MTRFVRFENHAGEEVCVNASYVIKVAPEMHTEYITEGNYSRQARFHVAGRCYMIVAGLGDVFVLGTVDEVLLKLEGK